jgi:hypothetical protein
MEDRKTDRTCSFLGTSILICLPACAGVAEARWCAMVWGRSALSVGRIRLCISESPYAETALLNDIMYSLLPQFCNRKVPLALHDPPILHHRRVLDHPLWLHLAS